jgi:predicted N-acetyltransferase YhbS
MQTAQRRDTHRYGSDIRLLEPADVPALSTFLRRCFGAPAAARFASPEMLTWKYLAAGSDAASYVVDRGGRIVGHAGLLRATVRGQTGAPVECAMVIDWAADVQAPGAGLALYRHAMRQAEVTYLIGGAPVTHVLADRIGFRRSLDAHVHARWVRPIQEFSRRPLDSRAWLRLAHGIVRASFRKLAPRRGWLIARVPRFDDAVSTVLASTGPVASARYDVASLNHRLACPGRRMRGHVLIKGGVPAGVAVTSVGDWEAKILFVQIDSTDPSDLSAAFALVTSALATERRVCRISALSTSERVAQALAANGFWRGAAEPALLYDPDGRAAGIQPIDLSYFDTDLDYCNA